MKCKVVFIIFISLTSYVYGTLFDRYSGKKFEEVLGKKVNKNCTIEIKPCAPHEGSRVDGTCNNFKHPTKGSARGPYLRLLNPDYANDKKDIRKDRNGKSLPSARKVRTSLQTDGRVADKHLFNIAAFHYLEFINLDISVLNGPLDYLVKRQYCCNKEGATDPRCKPILVPDDDPYLKVTDIRCLNFSRAETFQDNSCIPETIQPEQINFQTPVLDLSTIYGVDEKGLKSVRVYKHGLLNLEIRNYRTVPLANMSAINMATPSKTPRKNSIRISISTEASVNTETAGNITSNGTTSTTARPSLPTTGGLNDEVLSEVSGVTGMLTPDLMSLVNMTGVNGTICLQNMSNETRCYIFGFPEAGNFDLRTTSFAIFFMREHNRLARELHKLNPCWKDDRLFKVARQINIATAANIFYYELLPSLLGYKNMVHYGLISDHIQHLTAYDEDVAPLVYAEYEAAVRYYHTLLDGRIKLYDEKYQYESELSVSNTLYRQHVIETEKNFEKINRGTFFQHASKVDDIQDPEISEKYFGDLQRAADLPALDIQRGRDLGVRGYNDYRHLCGLKPAKKFEDFADVMEFEKIESLKELYDEVEDVDLLAGIMGESYIRGTFAGPTLFCIMAKQLQLLRFSDKFWFERGDQFHSFTLPQLHEVRRTSMARLACDNAEGIKFIQPRALLIEASDNRPLPCSHIDGLDIRKWKDHSCESDKHWPYKYSNQDLENDWPKKSDGHEEHWPRKPTDVKDRHPTSDHEKIHNYMNKIKDGRPNAKDFTPFFDSLLSYS